jgi:hypothetical protein
VEMVLWEDEIGRRTSANGQVSENVCGISWGPFDGKS